MPAPVILVGPVAAGWAAVVGFFVAVRLGWVCADETIAAKIIQKISGYCLNIITLLLKGPGVNSTGECDHVNFYQHIFGETRYFYC